MALPAPSLIPGGLHHAVASGFVDFSVAVPTPEGSVPGFGASQPMSVSLLAFSEPIRDEKNFGDQLYIMSKSLDGFITSVKLAPTPFVLDSDGIPIAVNLLLDISQASELYLIVESHHTAGR